MAKKKVDVLIRVVDRKSIIEPIRVWADNLEEVGNGIREIEGVKGVREDEKFFYLAVSVDPRYDVLEVAMSLAAWFADKDSSLSVKIES